MHQEHSVIVQVVQVGLSPRHFTHKLSHWSNWKLTQSSGSFLPLLLRVSPSVTLRSPLKMSGFGNRSSGFGRGRGGDEYSDGMCTYDMFVPAGDCGKIIGTLISTAVRRGPRVNHNVWPADVLFTFSLIFYACYVRGWPLNVGSEMLFLCSRYMNEVSECSVCFNFSPRS